MLKIPIIPIPREETMKEIAIEWFKPLENLCFESWSYQLQSISYPTWSIPMSKELCENLVKGYDDKSLRIHAINFGNLIDNKLREIGSDKFFTKISSRSPKDYMTNSNVKPDPQHTGEEIVASLLNSMRTFDDLCHMSYLPQGCNLHIRKYEDFKPEHEWRVLVNLQTNTIAISQYYYAEDFIYGPEYLEFVKKSISNILPIIHHNVDEYRFVADFVINPDTKDVKLIELNPFGMSDPCLFKSYDNLSNSLLTKIPV